MKESEKRDKHVDLARELKKTVEHEIDGDTNCNWRVQNSHQGIGTGTGSQGNKRTRREDPKYRIIEIGQNTEENPGDLRRIVVTYIQWKTMS